MKELERIGLLRQAHLIFRFFKTSIIVVIILGDVWLSLI